MNRDALDAVAARRAEATFGPMRMVGEDGDYTIVDQIGAEVAVVHDKATALFFAACATDVPAMHAELLRLQRLLELAREAGIGGHSYRPSGGGGNTCEVCGLLRWVCDGPEECW